MLVPDLAPAQPLTPDEARARKIAWRVAAFMLLATAALNGFALLMMPDLVTNRALSVVLMNVILAIGLLGDQSWARILTLLRAIAGGIVLVIFDLTVQDYFDMLFQIALAASFVIVLTGHPNKRRTLAGGGLFAAAFLAMSILYTLTWLLRLVDGLAG